MVMPRSQFMRFKPIEHRKSVLAEIEPISSVTDMLNESPH
jgi:hypothetical protein